MTANLFAPFWSLFAARHAGLAAAGSADSPVYDELLEALQRAAPGLFLEFSVEPGASELIVTADGNGALFPLAQAVVAAAPAVRGWTILALKPRLGFPKVARWEGFAVTLADVLFEPLERQGSLDLGLRLYVPGLGQADADAAHNALLRALDHGLGERRFAEQVQFVEVLARPAGVDAGQLIKLLDLERFLEWRESKRGA